MDVESMNYDENGNPASLNSSNHLGVMLCACAQTNAIICPPPPGTHMDGWKADEPQAAQRSPINSNVSTGTKISEYSSRFFVCLFCVRGSSACYPMFPSQTLT